MNFATGADVLIHDAQYTEEQYYDFPRSVQGFGHSTHLMAAEVGRQARVKQLVLFHHDPSQSDQEIDRKEREARTRYKHAIAAHEGLELKVL